MKKQKGLLSTLDLPLPVPHSLLRSESVGLQDSHRLGMNAGLLRKPCQTQEREEGTRVQAQGGGRGISRLVAWQPMPGAAGVSLGRPQEINMLAVSPGVSGAER